MLISSLQSRSVFGDRLCRSSMESREGACEEEGAEQNHNDNDWS